MHIKVVKGVPIRNTNVCQFICFAINAEYRNTILGINTSSQMANIRTRFFQYLKGLSVKVYKKKMLRSYHVPFIQMYNERKSIYLINKNLI